MNKTNLLTAVGLLQFAKQVNLAMIDGGHALTGKPFSEQEVLELKEEIIGAEMGIEALESIVRQSELDNQKQFV